jgi:hypothetical protein
MHHPVNFDASRPARRVLRALGVVAAIGLAPIRVQAGAFDHAAWTTLLAAHVDDAGRVAYRDLQARDRDVLDGYLVQLAAATPDSLPPAEQIAFWINAYNAGMVSAVLQGRTPEPPISRVKVFKFWKFTVAGKERTLDEVEHEILRRRFDEPRIHFALVCAATSCPPLRREAYRGADLDAQLDDQGRRFVRDRTRNVLDANAGTLRISKIFDWFRSDFEKSGGSVHEFLARYASDEATRVWLAGRPPISHVDYDWTLNAQPGQRPR